MSTSNDADEADEVAPAPKKTEKVADKEAKHPQFKEQENEQILNDRPIFGILTQPMHENQPQRLN